MHKYGESKTTRIMMATVRRTKYQAAWFLLNRVYNSFTISEESIAFSEILSLSYNVLYVLQFNDNAIYMYTVVILPILKFQYNKYQLL